MALRITAMLAGVALAVACGAETADNLRHVGPYGACSADEQCAGGKSCVCGLCARPCEADADCDEETEHCAAPGWDPASVCTGDAPKGMCVEACPAPDFRCSENRSCSEKGTCVSVLCNTNYRRFTVTIAPPVSFRRDVMPIFGLHCGISQCHNAKDRAADLYLGPRCDYDVATQTCAFPAATDPNTGMAEPPGPLTEKTVSQVRTALLGPSSTAPEAPLVSPGSPETSFLLDALAGTANNRGYSCTNQGPQHEALPKPCGDSMFPFGGPPCAFLNGPRRFDLIARWIAEGAADN